MGLEHDTQDANSGGVSRRGFLTGVGAAAGAAGAVALGPSEAVAQLVEPQAAAFTRQDRFTRLFDRLPSFLESTPEVRAVLTELGAPGGLLDAKDPLQEGPIRLITNPELSPNNRDNAAHTAGVTFFGQFLDHDMTFDTTSRLGVPTRPERSPNARTPGARPRLGVRPRSDGGLAAVRPRRSRQIQSRERRRSSRICRGRPRARPSSAIRATTRIS